MHTIMVIDDEIDVRDGIKRVLNRAGFSVRTVDNAMDAMVNSRTRRWTSSSPTSSCRR